MKMKGKVIAICGIVAVLGIISAAAGFASEITKVKDNLCTDGYAKVEAHHQRLGNSGCPGMDGEAPPLPMRGWIVSVIAVILLLGGAALNNREGEQKDSHGRITCYVVKSGILATGAVLSLLSAIFGIVAYVLIFSAKQMAPRLEFALPVATNVHIEKNVLPPTIL